MDWKEFFDVIIRSFTSLVVLFFLTKMLGKKQVSQLSLFDYVIGISMGSIAAEMTLNIDSSYISGFAAMTIYALIAYGVSFFTMKSIAIRRFVTGTPIILIEKGVIIKSGLKKALIDMDDLLEESRNSGYFDLSEIDYAIMETSGRISFLPTPDSTPVKTKDLDVKLPYQGLLANVVIDGKILSKNLRQTKKSEKWLKKELKNQGYKSLEELILVTVDSNKKVTAYPYKKKPKPGTVLE